MQKIFEIRMGTGNRGEKPVEMTAETLEKAFQIVKENPGKWFSITYGKKFIYVRITADVNGKFHSVYYQCPCCNPRPITDGRFFKKYIVIRPDGKARVNEIWSNIKRFWLESVEIDGTVFAYGSEIIRRENAAKFAEKKDTSIFNRKVGRDKAFLRRIIETVETDEPRINQWSTRETTVDYSDKSEKLHLENDVQKIVSLIDEYGEIHMGHYDRARVGKCGYDLMVHIVNFAEYNRLIKVLSDNELVFLTVRNSTAHIVLQVWNGKVINGQFSGTWYNIDRTKKKMDFVEIF